MNLQFNSPKKETVQTFNLNSHVAYDSLKSSEIFDKKINILIWKRSLLPEHILAAEKILHNEPDLRFSQLMRPAEVKNALIKKIGSNQKLSILFDDISNLIKDFCLLFDSKRAWLRLDAIDRPMCPRFHVDHVKCRLVTTYVGPATQWLPSNLVDRTKLGHGNQGLPDEKSGLFAKSTDIKELSKGHVALLKGESWDGNKGSGLVHRSPSAIDNYKRLYMTIDLEEFYLNIHKNAPKCC